MNKKRREQIVKDSIYYYLIVKYLEQIETLKNEKKIEESIIIIKFLKSEIEKYE